MDYKAKIESMKPFVEKLILYLEKKGIEFYWTDEDGYDNVVLVKGDKMKKIAYSCFYRFSGISSFVDEDEKKNIIFVRVTDDMYINSYQKKIIDMVFSEN